MYNVHISAECKCQPRCFSQALARTFCYIAVSYKILLEQNQLEPFQQPLKKVSAGILPFQQIFARTFLANTCQNGSSKRQKESFSRNFAVLAKTSQNCSSKTCQNRSSKNLPELSIQYNPASCMQICNKQGSSRNDVISGFKNGDICF